MSIPLLRELHEDVRRLFIAGAAVAYDDVRLKRVLPQLRQLGESAPIFKRIADEVTGVTEAAQDQASLKLLDLAALLQAVLHTQGNADVSGELETAGMLLEGSKWTTDISYRKLKPLVDALTLRGGGRFETIRQGLEDGLFVDLRTFVPAVTALEDHYSEIAEFVAERVMPVIGKAIVPILQDHYHAQGGSGDARKLTVLHQLSGGAAAVRDLVLDAVREGSMPVRLAAIPLAASDPDFEEELLQLTLDRKKEIRSTALLALSDYTSVRAIDRLMEALMKKDADIAVEPIRRNSDPRLTEKLLQYGSEVGSQLINGIKEPVIIVRMESVIQALEAKAKEASVREFLMQLLDQDAFDRTDSQSLQRLSAQILLDSNDPQVLTFLHRLRDRRVHLIDYSFKAAAFTLSSTELFDQYESYLSKKKNNVAKILIQALYELVPAFLYDRITMHQKEEAKEAAIKWDERWVTRFIDLNEEGLVCRLAERSDQRLIEYLVAKYKVAPQLLKPRTVHILYTLFKLDYKDAGELLMQALEQASPQHFYYLNDEMQVLIVLLPSRYADRLRQMAEKLKYEGTRSTFNELADHIASKTVELEQTNEGAGLIKWIRSKLF